MSRPTLRQLSFLVGLADAGTFRAAAEACGVTQPSLSSAIRELEGIIGATLVERGGRGRRLTQAGEETVARARRILLEADELAPAAQAAAAPLTGALRLGVIPTIAPALAPRLAPALRATYPDVQLYLREEQTDRLLEDLRDGTLDLAVLALPYHTPGVDTAAAFDEEFLLLAPEGHALLANPHLTIADVPETELLLLEDGHCLRGHVLTACDARAGGADRRAFAGTSLITLAHTVAGGLGVTLAPRMAVDAGVAAAPGVTARAFNPPLIGRAVGVGWRAGSLRARDGALLVQVLRDLAPQLKPCPRP